MSSSHGLAALDLNLLVVLDAVLAEGSVARAAARLHVTPSAVSNSLARLRAHLDDPLFTRDGRGIVATPRALELAPALGQALAELARVVAGERFDPATSQRVHTLAIADAGQVARVPLIVACMASEMPRAQLRVVGIDTLVASGGLAATVVDVAIGVAAKLEGTHAQHLYDERSVLVARAGHPAPARLTKARLGALRHVEVLLTPSSVSGVAARYAELGVPRQVAVVVPTFAAAAAIVAASDLVATLPESVVAGTGLRVLTSPVTLEVQPIHLVWNERTQHDPAQRAFRDVVVRALKQKGPQTRPDRSRSR